jgi:hypothetical protein
MRYELSNNCFCGWKMGGERKYIDERQKMSGEGTKTIDKKRVCYFRIFNIPVRVRTPFFL